MRAVRFPILRTGAAWLATLVLLAASACVVTESPVVARGVPVSAPPPAPQIEAQRPPPPSASSMWIAGYWHWTGMQYAWIPGHWESGPPGAMWTAPRYTATDGAYFYEPGTWKPASAATANALH